MQPVHLLLLFSVFFTYFGWIMLRKANRLTRSGRKATATVIDNRYSSDSDSADYTPIVKFTTDKQEEIIIDLNYAASRPTRLGKTVELLYDPTNPQEAEVNSVFRLVIIPWGLTALGVAGLLLASLEMLGITNIVMTEWEGE